MIPSSRSWSSSPSPGSPLSYLAHEEQPESRHRGDARDRAGRPGHRRLHLLVRLRERPGHRASTPFTESYQWVSTPSFSLDILFGVDGLSSPLVLAAAILTVFVIIGSRRLITERLPAYFALLLFFEGAIIGVFTSLNLVVFYVFWELVTDPDVLPHRNLGRRQAEVRGDEVHDLHLRREHRDAACVPRGLLRRQPVSSFDIPTLPGRIPAGLQYLPLLASFIGFGVKLPVVPFHSWLPDAYVAGARRR